MKILLVIIFILFLLFVGSMIFALCHIAGEADEAERELWQVRYGDKEEDNEE